jgi:hypothetical protein
MVLLDASKAFDKVHYVKLFRLLLARGLCPFIAKFLVNLYTQQTISVKWANCMSASVGISNGVKQGGVLSPVLFNVYIDELLTRLQRSGYGCRIGHVFAGALGYADDVTLLSPTKHGTRKLLNVCSEYAQEYDVSFNPQKCKQLMFGSQRDITTYFNGAVIETVTSDVHLGNPVGMDALSTAITNNVYEMCRHTNVLTKVFACATSDIKYKLFKSFGMCLYGSQLLDLSSSAMDELYVAWRKCVRRLMGVHPRTHCALLNFICGDTPVDFQLHKRFIKFLHTVLTSDNECVRICGELALSGSRSAVCNSANLVSFRYGLNKHLISAKSKGQLLKQMYGSLDNESDDARIGAMISELLHMRDTHSDILTAGQIGQTLDYLCVET